MPYTKEMLDELNMLIRYNLDTTLEGLKVHKTAAPEVIAATQRLYEKGLVSQADGGYLTAMGRETAEQAQAVFNLLNPAAT